MSILVPARVISVTPKYKIPPCSRHMTNSHFDWNNCHKYVNQICLFLETLNKAFALCSFFDVRLAFNVLRGNAIRALFTLYGSSPNVNTNTGMDTCALWETQSGRPDPFDILTCYIISWGYSISPISLSSQQGPICQTIYFKCQDWDLISRTALSDPVRAGSVPLICISLSFVSCGDT